MKKYLARALLCLLLWAPFTKLSSSALPREIYSIRELTNKKSMYFFLKALGHRESSNRYHVVNQYGYLGRWQVGRATLRGLGYTSVTKQEFLEDPALQREVVIKLLKHNKYLLRKYIQQYEGKVIKGVVITESGILAAAHLAGPYNVKKYLRNRSTFQDGNGTSLESYLLEFSGYQLKLDARTPTFQYTQEESLKVAP